MSLLLLLGAGTTTNGAPAAPDYKRIPNAPRLATIPTFNRKKVGK